MRKTEAFLDIPRSGHELDCRALRHEMKKAGISLSVLESLESRVKTMVAATKAGKELEADQYFLERLPAAFQVATAFKDEKGQEFDVDPCHPCRPHQLNLFTGLKDLVRMRSELCAQQADKFSSDGAERLWNELGRLLALDPDGDHGQYEEKSARKIADIFLRAIQEEHHTRQHKKNELLPEEHHSVVALKIKSPVNKVIKSFKCIDGRWQILFKNGKRYHTARPADDTWDALIKLATSSDMDKEGYVVLPKKIGALAKGMVSPRGKNDVVDPICFLQAKRANGLYRFVLPTAVRRQKKPLMA